MQEMGKQRKEARAGKKLTTRTKLLATQILCIFSVLHMLFSSACNVLLLSTPGKRVQIHLDSVKHRTESMYLLIFSLSSFGTQAMRYSSLMSFLFEFSVFWVFCCLALQLTHNGHTNICWMNKWMQWPRFSKIIPTDGETDTYIHNT